MRVLKPDKPPRKRHGNRQPGDRKVAGTDRQTLIVEMIPRKTIQEARLKAKQHGVTLKAVITDMLEAYASIQE